MFTAESSRNKVPAAWRPRAEGISPGRETAYAVDGMRRGGSNEQVARQAESLQLTVSRRRWKGLSEQSAVS
jgi:hypothetical protein